MKRELTTTSKLRSFGLPTAFFSVRRRRTWGAIFVSASLCASCEQDKPLGVGGAGGAGGASHASSSTSSATSTTVASSGAPLPDVFIVTGVVTDGQKPVAGATVMQGGGKPAFETGPDGAYTIQMTKAIPGTPTIVASKMGYRTGGVEFVDLPVDPVEIVMHEVAPPDNIASYTYGAPGVGDAQLDNSTAVCGHCHTTLVAQFLTSAHAKATRDPLVQDLYAGTANRDKTACLAVNGVFRTGRLPGSTAGVVEKCYVAGGVLPDVNGCGAPNALACDDPSLGAAEKPTQFGHCADCHAAGLPGPTGGRNLLDATGNAFDHGNHCDVCHKVRDVDLTQPAGVAGRLMIQRPRETVTGQPGAKLRQVMFGPLLDVPNEFMGGSYQPKFSQAVFCAGCHEHTQEALIGGTNIDPTRFPNGLPTHSTYSEWTDGAWSAAGVQCQHCHMPPNDKLLNTVDTTKSDSGSITFGFQRPPEQIRAHAFRGPLAGPSRLLDVALGMWLDAKIVNGDLSIQIKLSNQGAGHALPTGEPMRALLLVVQANACGQELVSKEGPTIDDVGGALARGVVGQDITVAGQAWSWSQGAAIAQAGLMVRVVRETGQWIDYPGIGFFANPALAAAAKGIPLRTNVGQARVVSASNGTLMLDQAISVQPGDIVWLGEDTAGAVVDGGTSLALAGLAGQSFARVLTDAAGERFVPHYKAVDIVSDNRLPPLEPIASAHVFALPAGCATVAVNATVVYRPIPLAWGQLRGWETRDWVAATRNETVPIP